MKPWTALQKPMSYSWQSFEISPQLNDTGRVTLYSLDSEAELRVLGVRLRDYGCHGQSLHVCSYPYCLQLAIHPSSLPPKEGELGTFGGLGILRQGAGSAIHPSFCKAPPCSVLTGLFVQGETVGCWEPSVPLLCQALPCFLSADPLGWLRAR